MTIGNHTLHVDYCGEIHEVPPDKSLTFGRSADLVIDSNRQLHRTAGRFFYEMGIWWLENVGRTLDLQIVDLDSRSSVLLTPRRRTSLTFARSAVRFQAGPTTYEILLDVPQGAEIVTGTVGDTVSTSDVPLVEEQLLLLVALAEPKLREPHRPTYVPPNKQIAERLGWSITKFNRKLDNVCAKYTKAGVSGLRGSPDNLAADRRRRLVEHVVAHGIVCFDDLSKLDQIERPDPDPDPE